MKSHVFIADERGFQYPAHPSVTIINRGANWGIDIGFLELKVDEHVKALCGSSCSLDHLAVSDLVKGDMHHIVGFPVAKWERKGATTELVKCGFGSKFQEKEGDYLLFPFPKEQDWFRQVGGDDFTKMTFIDKPHGFSGGGLWAFNRQPEGEMFIPEKHIKLRGIQSEWCKVRRVVKCVPIHRWLELIHEKFPELRAELEEKWPILRR